MRMETTVKTHPVAQGFLIRLLVVMDLPFLQFRQSLVQHQAVEEQR
jgi:hypothetical protein